MLLKNVSVKVELPKYGAPTVTAFRKSSPAGGARFRASDDWHKLITRDWATPDGELVRLGVGMSAGAVPADAGPMIRRFAPDLRHQALNLLAAGGGWAGSRPTVSKRMERLDPKAGWWYAGCS